MNTSGTLRKGRPLAAGDATGTALVLSQPVSFSSGEWSGRISDIRSPQRGAIIRSRILVMPVGRGSSSAALTLAEAIRLGTGPRAIILPGIDQILAVGAIVARRLYGTICPVLVVDPADYAAIATGDRVTIRRDGTFSIEPRRPKASGAAAPPRPRPAG